MGKWLSCEDDKGASYQKDMRGVRLVDILPRFMDLSAQIIQLTETRVTAIWLQLAADFMLQAAMEGVLTSPIGSHGPKINHETLLACFGWGLPIDMSNFVRSMDDEDPDLMATETAIHQMLLSSTTNKTSETTSWESGRTGPISALMEYIHPEDEEAEGADWDIDYRRYHFVDLRERHSIQEFEIQVLDYIKNLQLVWAQLNDEPILLQIEQGRLEGLDEEEFRAFMDRVSSDEHEERLQRIKVPGISNI